MRHSQHNVIRLHLLLMLSGLMLGISAPLAAHHCKGKHAQDPSCDGGGGGGGGGESDDTSAIPLVCSFTDTAGDSFLSDGLGAYPDDVDKVTCTTGDTKETSGASRIRWYTFGSGSLRKAVRKVDVVIDESTCTNPGNCNAVPDGVFEAAASIDDMEDGRFFVEASEGEGGLVIPHIQQLPPDATYQVQLDFALMGTARRWVFQLRGQTPNCELDESAPVVMGDDATLYVWADGDLDGKPDGYTLTTAAPENLDTTTSPPTVNTVGTRTATLCSNEGIDGSGCGGAGGAELCHLISQMEVQFTWHAQNQ